MLISTRNLVLFGTALILWMALNTFITNSFGIALVLFTVVLGAIQYVKLPRLDESRVSDNILSLFKFDNDDLKKNIIFHKGGAHHAPENTVEAIQMAADLGVRSVEIDLEFSKDGVGVVIHGPKVDDTTDGTGFVSNYTFDQLQKLNAAAKDANKSRFPSVRVPSLEDCVKECIKQNLILFIDCKSNASETAQLVCSLFQKYPALYGNAVVCSFYPTIIYALRQRDPTIVTAVTHRAHILTLLGDGTERNKELWKRLASPPADALLAWAHWAVCWYICGNCFFLCSKDSICLDSKNFWSSLGVRLVAWTVNDPLEQNFFLRHLEVPIITDGLVQGGPVFSS
ncbi:glycerophosphodiester phosphodiesterase 1 [Aplysia californica]|uniref:Glycerophosphodiester phosphodiesterase 1 n=1 Tax=Aplysia californica TaxID=6500 RepID=A0ABM1A5S8_APLCA|nr:glycerophosphodiester phosphodiesterase 1 [Aplysia californica]